MQHIVFNAQQDICACSIWFMINTISVNGTLFSIRCFFTVHVLLYVPRCVMSPHTCDAGRWVQMALYVLAMIIASQVCGTLGIVITYVVFFIKVSHDMDDCIVNTADVQLIIICRYPVVQCQ